MIRRFTIALSVIVLAAALFASSTPAQVRGMRASGSAPRAGASFRLGGRSGVSRGGRRPGYPGYPLLPFPYLYPDYDYDSVEPETPPIQVLVAPPAQPPAPAPAPVESLLLENHNGQWVRIPTGGQLPAPAQSPRSAQATSLGSGMTSQKEAGPSVPPLPQTVLVFRDGRREEIGKYIIQGNVIEASTDYWSAGSWTKKIPIAALDIPATQKLNEERGGKFNLPSAPNQVEVRF
jgi:hypothetical protein